MNAVFSRSSLLIIIWFFPKKRVHERQKCVPYFAATNWSIWSNGKLSFRHALLRSVKSTQTGHFPFFFSTMTGLASQSGYLTSVLDPTLRSFLTLSLTVGCVPVPTIFFAVWQVWKLRQCWVCDVLCRCRFLVCLPQSLWTVWRFFFRQAINSVFKGSQVLAPISA